ncbi:MAG: enoyl-[acyl-carrier-protein] reductase FabK [bacterium]|nr:enoyl-[acyl-carrier-protein] reductase FabK [bacterium]
MTIRTPICDLLGIDAPIILGGMMGISDGRLTAAVSEAGGLGTLSTATFGPDGTRSEIEKIRSVTDKPFSLNLPIFHPMVPDLVEVVTELEVPIVTTSAGSPGKFTSQLKDAGVTVIHVVSSLRTALKTAAAGVDALVVEGIESGGKVSREEVPTISLVPQVADAVDIPIIAAGGLADGRGLLAALALGAQGVQMGTRFLATDEAPAHDNWKKVLVDASDADTAVACRQSSPTRMIRNAFFEEMDALDEPGKNAMDYMGIQGEGMARIPGDSDGSKGSYIAGTGAGLITEVIAAGEVVREIMREAESELARVNAFAG